MIERPLGRREPTNWLHTARYPLTATTVPTTPVPVVLGVLWYANFDRPVVGSDGRWWIGRGDLGHVRGGHAVCLKPQSLTDPTGWLTYYDQGHEGACFPKGTRIRMADGEMRPIDQVRLLDQVQTAEGNVGVVTNLSARWHTEGLVYVRLRGHAGVKATAEHPIRTDRGYVPIGELRPGDVVALPRRLQADETSIIPALAMVSARAKRSMSTGTRTYASPAGRKTSVVTMIPVPETITLTAEWGRLFGLYLAEGAAGDQRVVWTFGGHEKDTLVAETVNLVESCMGATPHVQYRGSGAINVVVYGKAWREVFEGLFGAGSHAKVVPPVLMTASAVVRRSLIDGWLAGDGHRRRTSVQGVTVSQDLALGMHAIANDLGMFPTIARSAPSMNEHAATRRERWDVMIPEGNGHRPEMTDDAVWRKVSAVTFEDWEGFVYNMTVAGDNSYVADGIGVHNCVGFAASRAMSLLNRKRYDARWLYREAQRVDEWEGEAYSGTSVRAAMDVLRRVGHAPTYRGATRPVDASEGIVENRWAQSVDEVLACLQSPLYASLGAVQLLNSWGRDYPRTVWLPLETLDRLIREDGEATIITDRP